MRFIQKEASQRLPDYYAELAKHDIPHRADLLLRAALTSEAIAEEHRAFELRMRPDFSPQNDPFAEDDLLRLCRTLGEKTKLLELYEGLGDKTSQEASSVYLSHAAALHLERGNSRVAEALARRTLDAQEDNLLARAILAEVLRKDGRITDLRETLDSLIAHAGAESNRGAWLREQANLADTPLRALDLLEQALAIDANDLTTMVSLAAIYELEDRFTDAVGLREKIASRLPDRDAQAAAYIHVGEIYRDRLSDLESAGKAFQAALDRCPDHPTALLRISEIYERLGNDDLLLDVLGHRRELESDPDALSALERDRARCFDRLSRVDETLEALAHSLVLTPGAVPTIELLTHTCRHAQRWEDLAEILAEQPPSEEILQARAEALEQLGQFPALIEVREALFKRSPSVPERADRAYDLGRVYEHHDALDKATQWYQLATEELASHRPALGALSRIYRDAGNLPDLTKVLGEELRWVDDVRDRTDILLELASAKEDLGDPHAAAAHLEEALEIVPDLPLVLDTLEQIYAVDRPVDLANLLRHRAKVEDDKRAAHLLRAAQIFAAHDLREEATVAFRDAILADLSNREIFTAAEAFFYEHELWREVMEIYDILIDACTTEGLRAYRFADLFSRRGQIQVRHLAQPGEAAASFFSALEHDPKSESSLRALTEIFVQQQDWRGLIHAYEFRASLLPDNELFRLESLRQAALLASSRLPPDAPEAQRLWEEIVEIDPADDQGLASLTVIYRSAQDLEKLASVLETRVALESDSNHSLEMLLELARISEVGLDDAERASRAYEKVLALNEHHEEALTALARIYEATARWEPCMDALNGLILIEADPDERSLLYFKCGSIAEARFHSDDKAIHLYKRSLDESAGCMPALHGLRDIYRRQDRWKDALDTLEAELDIWDDDRERAGVLARIGEILLKHLDAPDQADHRFEEALTLDPDCQPALSALFNGAYEKKDASRALAFADRLAPHMVNEGDPDKRADFYLRRGLLLRDHHDVTQAADSLVVALELAPSHIQALDALISLCRIAPDAYDFAAVFRKLEEVYRRDENPTAAAHVSIAAGTLAELAGDADMALDLYRQAQKQAPTAFEPVDTLAHLLVALRRPQEAVTELHAYIDATEEHRERIDALLRLGEIYSEILDQGQAAMNAYEAILSIDMRHREGVFRLAQELYGLNRPQQARQLIDQLLDPELHPNLPVDERARYLHYLGAIQLRLGQTAAAIKNFRRALQQNHLCVEAALALSHQLARNGDRTQAIELLGHTIHEIGSQRGIATTGELRRALGSLFLGAGDLDAAINEYEALARDEEHIDDHVMLAELYARRPQGASRAISVLTEVIVQQTLAPQAFGLLAHLYDTKGEGDRTMQVLQVAELLGLARNAQKNRIEDLRQEFPFVVQRGLDERSRRALVRNKSTGQAIDRLWKVIHPALTQIFPLGVSDRRLAPVEQANAPDFVDAIHDTLNILTSPATALLAPKLPSAVLPDDSDPPRILIDRLWVQTPPTEVRFTVGRALGLQIAGHAILGRLAFHDRQLVVELLAGLLLDPTQRSDLAEEFLRRFDEEHLAQINAISANYQQGLSAGQPPEDPARWIAMVDHSAHIHGLIACDDIGVALRQIAILNGQTLAVSPGGEVAVSAVSGGPALVQYFLGDTYAQLRRRICAS
ncbi:MAG: tetratricopeptide repeat protein [Deltaproteobacteria bacterium]|nr:tetratricopeptide repeat protein [Deltaproteobacteria bacterium]